MFKKGKPAWVFDAFIPDVLTSVKSVWDLSGQSAIQFNHNLLELSDEEALGQDWKAIGDDLRNALSDINETV